MNKLFLVAAIMAIGSTASFAQTADSSSGAISGSTSGANSGSASQATGGYAESGTSRSISASGSIAGSNSAADAYSTGIGFNQQSQGQTSTNTQGQSLDNTNNIANRQGQSQDASNRQRQGQAQDASNKQGQSQGQIQGQGNKQDMYNINIVPEVQTINNNQHISGTQVIKNVPATYAPALSSSNDTCMGSSSVGGSGVGFGFSVGTSWTDANCVMLKNARELFNMGMPEVAFARLCMDTLNREAIELTGKLCPQTIKEQKAKAAEVAKTTQTEQF